MRLTGTPGHGACGPSDAELAWFLDSELYPDQRSVYLARLELNVESVGSRQGLGASDVMAGGRHRLAVLDRR